MMPQELIEFTIRERRQEAAKTHGRQEIAAHQQRTPLASRVLSWLRRRAKRLEYERAASALCEQTEGR